MTPNNLRRENCSLIELLTAHTHMQAVMRGRKWELLCFIGSKMLVDDMISRYFLCCHTLLSFKRILQVCIQEIHLLSYQELD